MTAAAPATAGPEASTGPGSHTPRADRVLIIGCGALARELRRLAEFNAAAQIDVEDAGAHDPGTGGRAELNAAVQIDVECLPARLHNRPEQIAPAVRRRLREAKAGGAYRTILVGYMDCGTGGLLDRVCAEEGVQRLPGAHCYEMYAGAETFAGLQDPEPGTFYLTDYLVRHFDRLILDGLGITEHPELLEMYFGNYTRVVHMAQTDDPGLADQARRAAARLGLRCERIVTGLDELHRHVVELSSPPQARAGTPSPSRALHHQEEPSSAPANTPAHRDGRRPVGAAAA